VQSYEWHQLSAAREYKATWTQIDEPKVDESMLIADFMEKLGVPLGNSQSSGMFHGSQRKSLSVLGAYIVQRFPEIERVGVILISDVVETTAAYGNVCIRQCINHVDNVGKLATLRLRFDCGNHFRSAENLACFAVELPRELKQHMYTSYLVEKHGKHVCDSELFAAVRRWVREYLARPHAFIGDEHRLLEVLKEGAAKDMKFNPSGLRFIIELTAVPDKKPTIYSKLELPKDQHLTRSYCWESVLHDASPNGILIKNWVFSDSTECTNLGGILEECDRDKERQKKEAAHKKKRRRRRRRQRLRRRKKQKSE
jgi:hypothetical protein